MQRGFLLKGALPTIVGDINKNGENSIKNSDGTLTLPSVDTAITAESASREQEEHRKQCAMPPLQDHREEASAPCAEDLIERLQERVTELENLMDEVLKSTILTRERMEYIVFVLVKAFATHGHIDIVTTVTQIAYNTDEQQMGPDRTAQELIKTMNGCLASSPGPNKRKEKITYTVPLATNPPKPQAAKPKALDSPKAPVSGAAEPVLEEEVAEAEEADMDVEQPDQRSFSAEVAKTNKSKGKCYDDVRQC